MTRDEARQLLGGYATGSLTEAEREALFEAALEDQELFEELAGEQALKEVLDEPGARQRLIAALEPPRRHRVWLWAYGRGDCGDGSRDRHRGFSADPPRSLRSRSPRC